MKLYNYNRSKQFIEYKKFEIVKVEETTLLNLVNLSKKMNMICLGNL